MSDDQPHLPESNLDAGPSWEGMSYAILRRYASGASDPAERRRVETWAAESAERRAYLAAVRRAWLLSERDTPAEERPAADAAWAALGARLDVPADTAAPYVAPWEEPAVEIDVGRRPRVRMLTGAFESRRRWRTVSTAAAAAGLAAGATLLLQTRSDAPNGPAQAAPMREVATATGQRAEVRLGDGSVVTLGAQSRLRIPADFGLRDRELSLEGEAHFVVVHDTLRPFVVRAAGTRTVDLGTAFVLRAYPADERVQVVVTEGSVALGADRPDAPAGTVLTEGRMGRLAKGAATPEVQTVNPALYTSWLQGRLTFDDTPLSEVARELSRWNDVDVRFADPSLARERLTANFAATSLSEALMTLTTVLDLRAERSGRTVVLHRPSR